MKGRARGHGKGLDHAGIAAPCDICSVVAVQTAGTPRAQKTVQIEKISPLIAKGVDLLRVIRW